MKTKFAAVLGLIAFLAMALVAPANAKSPLTGEMDLGFNLGWTEPGTDVPIWVGTVTIDEADYGMAFFNIGTGKPFAEHPSASVSFFGEIWEIYDVDTGVMDPAAFVRGDILMAGTDQGVVSFNNNKYRMNGSVEEAYGIFEMWAGRRVHMSGTVEFYPFGAPQFAPGTFRVN